MLKKAQEYISELMEENEYSDAREIATYILGYFEGRTDEKELRDEE